MISNEILFPSVLAQKKNITGIVLFGVADKVLQKSDYYINPISKVDSIF